MPAKYNGATPLERPPNIVFTAKSKGGVGATTLALCIADQYDLLDAALRIFQIDNQARLATSIGREVTAIALPLNAARRDPALLIRAFDPIADGIESIRVVGGSILIDFGPNETARFLEWARLADVDEDLVNFGLSAIVFVPGVAEPEAIRAAAETLRGFKTALPSVRRVFVRNERDGQFERLHAASEAARAWSEDLKPHLNSAAEIRMPAIEAGSWRWFEAACLRFTDAVGLSTDEVMALTGLSRSEAKIVRGDVAAWFQQMQDALSPFLSISGEPS